MSVFYVNLLVTFISLVIILYVLHYIIYPTISDLQRFKLYALRDKLAALAMKGKIKETHREYEVLMHLIITTINFYERDFSISSFFKDLIQPQLDKAEEINSIIDSIENNENLKNIYYDFFEIFSRKLKNDTFVFRCAVSVLVFCLPLIKIHVSSINGMISAAIRKKKALQNYKEIFVKPALHLSSF